MFWESTPSHIHSYSQILLPFFRRFVELFVRESESFCHASGHHDVAGLVHVYTVTCQLLSLGGIGGEFFQAGLHVGVEVGQEAFLFPWPILAGIHCSPTIFD